MPAHLSRQDIERELRELNRQIHATEEQEACLALMHREWELLDELAQRLGWRK